jgi:hypothetical protein
MNINKNNHQNEARAKVIKTKNASFASKEEMLRKRRGKGKKIFLKIRTRGR